jgi:SpoVK/Ycf46/Vps4 family AAA+-type ATPase
MARGDLLLSLVKSGIEGDQNLFRKTVEAISAEEKAKQHYALAERLDNLLLNSTARISSIPTKDPQLQNAFYEIRPQRLLNDIILADETYVLCREIIEEHHRKELLRTYNLEPRHRILLSGPPGNGKTTLAEAFATELMLPLFVAKYEGIVGSLLGSTAQQLDRLFEHVKSQRCVLFFDEFDAIGKERDDVQEVGEIKRVVNSLLKQIDMLPSHVVVIGATNHSSMLDRAVWRRFHVQVELPLPTQREAEKLLDLFALSFDMSFGIKSKDIARNLKGLSFAELEEFCLDIRRRYILGLPDSDIELITATRLKIWSDRFCNKK